MRQVLRGALAVFLLGSGMAFVGCGDAGHKGELMLVIQTDMSLPKDVDRARIEVLAYGAHKFDQEFKELGSDGSLKLPGTIGVLVGEDPKTPVTVRVTAFQGATARVLREAVSTVPESRLAQLRMPVQWLCDGFSTTDEEGNVKTSCGEGLTCIAGSCTSSQIDSSELPDYNEESIFGGGSGDGDGSCFDTANCMRGSNVVPILDGSCAASVAGDINVAILTQGDGICGPSGCFVPLDANSDAGWKRTDDSTIALPQGLCDKLATGEIVGIATTPVSDACPLKDETLPTCGPWSSSGGETEPPGVGEPVALAIGQDHPGGLASDGTRIFWINQGAFGASDSALRGVAIEGGTPTTILPDLAGTRDLAVDGSTLYFTLSGIDVADGKVYSVVPGATATDLTRNIDGDPTGVPTPEGIAARGALAFFTTFGEGGVYFASTDGSSVEGGPSFRRLVFDRPLNYPYRVDFDETFLFWINEGTATSDPPDGSVMSMRIGDLSYQEQRTPTVLADAQLTPRAMALDVDAANNASALYFTTFSEAGEIKRVDPRDPGAVVTLASGQSFPNGIAVDASYVYWTNRGAGTVLRIAKDAPEGTEPTEIASSQFAPGPIVVDATHIFWANEGTSADKNGSIMKIGKPEATP